MREMKDSGVEWLGKIPQEWEVCKIKNVVEIYTGNSIKDEKKGNYEDSNDAIPYISTKDVNVIYNTVNYENGMYTKINDNSFKSAPKGSSLMCIEGGSAGKKKAYLNQTVSFVNKLCCFSPISIDGKYLFYFLLSPNFEDEFKRNILGLIGGVSTSIIKNISYLLPPILEQQCIAKFLDIKCSEIDSLRADIETEIATLEEYKKSVITEAVTKGLNPDVEMRESGVKWVGMMPKNWSLKKLKYLTVQRNEKGLFKSNQDCYIGLENVKSYSNGLVETTSEYEDSVQSICRINDVLFSKLRPYLAKVIISPYNCFCTGEFLQFCAFDGDKRFLRYYMLNNGFIKIVNASTYGAKMPRANTEFITNLLMTYPPYDEQQQIAGYLDKKCTEIDSIISEKKQQLEILDEYKKSLIYEYVTGKKEVPDNE